MRKIEEKEKQEVLKRLEYNKKNIHVQSRELINSEFYPE